MSAAAGAAATFIRESDRTRSSLLWRVKSAADFVSEVDTGAEERIERVLHAVHPEAVIVGEELSPESASDGALTFVVDPLDGTTNFLHGYPQYCVSIGAIVHGEPVAGVVLNVPTGELFAATAGGGAFRNGEAIRVSPIDEPGRSLIGTGFPFKHLGSLELYQRQFAAIARETAGLRRAGAAALDLCDVACGRFEGFWELTLAPWDVAAGILLVREAGGVATDLEGAPAPIAHGPVVCGNPTIHAWLLKTLASAR